MMVYAFIIYSVIWIRYSHIRPLPENVTEIDRPHSTCSYDPRLYRASNPVANRAESHQTIWPIQSLTFLQSCDEVDLCGCVFFLRPYWPIPFRCRGAKALAVSSARREHGSSLQSRSSSEFYAVSQDFNCHHYKLYLFKMLVCWHGGCISAQMVFTSSCTAISRWNHAGKFLTLHCLAGHCIHLLIHFLKPKSEKPPTSLLYCMEERPRLLVRATKNSLHQIVWFNPSLHDWRYSSRMHNVRLYSISSPAIVHPGCFPRWLPGCHAALSLQSVTAALCDLISMHLTWVTCLCRAGGREAFKLHCRGHF